MLSVDINPISSETYRLATSGGDSHVLVCFQLYLNKEALGFSFIDMAVELK